MSLDLYELLESVNNEQLFIGFIQALGSDFSNERVLKKMTPSSPYGPVALGGKMGL